MSDDHERAHVGFWDWHFERQHLEWSASCKRMFGFAADEPVTYERFMAAVHPEDRDKLRGDGTVRWVHVKGDATFVDRRLLVDVLREHRSVQ